MKEYEVRQEKRRVWFRSNEDGTYTAWMYEWSPWHKGEPWLAGGGTFSLNEFTEADIKWCKRSNFGVENPRNVTEEELAKALFMDNWSMFDLFPFKCEADALKWVQGAIVREAKNEESH